MRTLLIDDVGISITVKWYFNLLGKRVITECYDNIQGKNICIRPWQGRYQHLAKYTLAILDKVIKTTH